MPRAKKDPNKPKGKSTAYAYFVQTERENMRAASKENGTDDAPSFTELSKLCSEKWKTLDDADKSPFFKLAKEDKQRYEQEMANYVPSEDEETPKKSRKRKRQQVDENQPKRNKSGYLFFCEDQRPKVKENQPELSMTDIAKVLGAMWSSVPDKQKEKYTKQAEEDKERYVKEMAAYKQGLSDDRGAKKFQQEA